MKEVPIKDVVAKHYIIFSICMLLMYCRHTKKNMIQLTEYKDCNGGLQPLQHAFYC